MNKQSGSTLIEVLIVAFLMTLSLGALVNLVTISMARNRQAKETVVATRLAQEGMEWFKAERNRLGFNGFMSYIPEDNSPDKKNYCLQSLDFLEPGSTFGPCQLDSTPDYLRWFVVDEQTPDYLKLTINVLPKGRPENMTHSIKGSIYRWQR